MIIKAFATIQEYNNHLHDPEAPINLTSADDAVGGITYTCPFCCCGLYVKTSSNGVKFFSCYSGKPHTNRICRRLSHRRDVVDTDIPEFDLNRFFEALLTPEREPVVPPIGDIDNPDDDDNHLQDMDILAEREKRDEILEVTRDIEIPDECEDDADIIPWPDDDEDADQDYIHVQVVPARTIRDILDLGYHRVPGDAIINNDSHIKASDIIIALPSLQRLIDDPCLLDQHYKIVEMRAATARHKDMTIICRAFRKNENGKYNHIYFYLKANRKRQYEALLKKLFKKEENDNGNSSLKPKHKSIYIGGYWVRSKEDHNYNGQISPRFDIDIVNITNQVCCRSDEIF